MSENLYFIPIIERALKGPDVAVALEKAFGEIERKNAQEYYIEGCRNFELFMDIAYSRREVVIRDYIRRLIAELGIGTFCGTEQERKLLLDVVNTRPDWKKEYEAFCRQYATGNLVQDISPIIQVSHNERIIGELDFDKVPGRESIGSVVPGKYALKLLDTGWTIWQGELTARELIRTQAFGEVDLGLAAGDGEGRPTRQRDLLNNGEVILRTYAGIESGSVEIELTR